MASPKFPPPMTAIRMGYVGDDGEACICRQLRRLLRVDTVGADDADNALLAFVVETKFVEIECGN